jgi:glycerol-3-phosphate acyltransferase PlsX
MQRKIPEGRTTQKNQKIFPAAPIAAKCDFPTASARLAATTESERLCRLQRNRKIIGIDLMGSDNAPSVLLDALGSLYLNDDIELLAIGTPEYGKGATIRYIAASDFISMDENPLSALRKKRGASLCIGMRLLKEGAIDAFVSAGNTGALVTAARLILSTLPHLLRPALLALMPTKKRPVAVLDVGANVQVKATHLVQFALMGAAYLRSRGIDHPSIGFLNIGPEAVKGTSDLRLAYQELQGHAGAHFRFAGNIEGKSVFDGEVDALITDGFTGNVFLKTAEGIASLILDRIDASLPKEILQKLGPQINDLHRHLHYGEYPGALLAGVRGIVIKCHGYSTPHAFLNGVRGAIDLATSGFMEVFQDKLDLSRTRRC